MSIRIDVIRLAGDAGFDPSSMTPILANLERLVDLAQAAEREACAKVCDAQGEEWDSDAVETYKNYAAYCATAIRARGTLWPSPAKTTRWRLRLRGWLTTTKPQAK